MAFIQPFNAATVEPAKKPPPLPAGVYNAQITDSKTGVLASGNGEGIGLTWDIIDGPCAGRKVFQHINYRHANPEAERIGQSELSAVCHAVNVMQLQDTQQLHGRPCRIKVSIDSKDKDRNRVTGWEPMGAAQPGMPPAGAPPAQPAAPAATASTSAANMPPWARRA